MKTFFIIPGFRMQASHKMFSWLVKYLDNKGYKVVKVPVRWNFRTMAHYIEDFKEFYHHHKSEENYILGFSYGAVMAFATASELKPNKVYLCSLSPDFQEDVSAMTPWIRLYIGQRRILDTQSRSARKIAKDLSIPTVVFYGEKEGEQYPQMKLRCEETVNLARNSKLVVVKDAPHNISHPEYQKALLQELK